MKLRSKLGNLAFNKFTTLKYPIAKYIESRRAWTVPYEEKDRMLIYEEGVEIFESSDIGSIIAYIHFKHGDTPEAESLYRMYYRDFHKHPDLVEFHKKRNEPQVLKKLESERRKNHSDSESTFYLPGSLTPLVRGGIMADLKNICRLIHDRNWKFIFEFMFPIVITVFAIGASCSMERKLEKYCNEKKEFSTKMAKICKTNVWDKKVLPKD